MSWEERVVFFIGMIIVGGGGGGCDDWVGIDEEGN